MVTPQISFLTPYWSGAAMMRIHLASIRRFHPEAPILVSKRGGDRDEMESYRRDFGVEYWLEDCGYTNAYLRLLQRCRTRLACVLDHDVVLLASIERQARRVSEGSCDLVGVEERIRLPESIAAAAWPGSEGWLRFAPGCTASNFLIFDWQSFSKRFGLRGIFGTPQAGARDFDFDYGIGQRLPRHHYLRPFHAARYGLGNLLQDEGAPVAWHQWYGSYRTRLTTADPSLQSIAEEGERAFLADYPALDLADLTPASPASGSASTTTVMERPPMLARARRELGYSLRTISTRIVVSLERVSRDAGRG